MTFRAGVEVELDVDGARHRHAVPRVTEERLAFHRHLRRVVVKAQLATDPLDGGNGRDRLGARAERAIVNPRKVREVHEVLDSAQRRGGPRVRRALDHMHRRVVPRRMRGDRRARPIVEAHPHEVVRVGRIEGLDALLRRERTFGCRRDLDALPVGRVTPAVVRAAHGSGFDPTDRKARRTVSTPVGHRHHPVAHIGNGEVTPEQLHRERMGPGRVELRARANRMPEVLERPHQAHGDHITATSRRTRRSCPPRRRPAGTAPGTCNRPPCTRPPWPGTRRVCPTR